MEPLLSIGIIEALRYLRRASESIDVKVRMNLSPSSFLILLEVPAMSCHGCPNVHFHGSLAALWILDYFHEEYASSAVKVLKCSTCRFFLMSTRCCGAEMEPPLPKINKKYVTPVRRVIIRSFESYFVADLSSSLEALKSALPYRVT